MKADAAPATPRRHSGAVSALGLLLCCVPFYVSVVPPMADLPAHVLVARIIAEYNNPVLRYADYFIIDWAATPTALFYVLLVFLQNLVGAFWDARVYLTIWVVALWCSIWCLAKVQGRHDPWLAGLVGLPISFCWYAYSGFLPFLMSIPLFALTVAAWLHTWEWWKKIPVLWALLTLTLGFHIVGAAAAGATLTVTACARAMNQRDWRPLVWAGVALSPLLLMTGLYVSGQRAPSVNIRYAGPISQVVDVVKFTCTTLSDVGTFLMLAWLCLLVAVVSYWRCNVTTVRPVLLSALCLFVLSVALPQSLGSLWPAGPRLLPFALLLLIAHVSWSHLPRRSVVSASLVLVTALSVSTSWNARLVDRGLRDALGAAAFIEPGTNVLPIVDGSIGSRWTAPFLHVAALYTVIRGGSNPYALAAPNVLTGASPLRFRRTSDARQFAFMYDPTRTAEDYSGVSGHYDYVFFWGRAPAIAAVVELEMRRVYEQGNATLFARPGVAPDRVRAPVAPYPADK